MLRRLDHLDGGVLPDHGGEVDRQRNLRQAETSVIQEIVRPGDFEHGLHGQGVVNRDSAFAKVDVEECVEVAVEPAWLDTDGAAGDRPEGAIFRYRHTSTCEGLETRGC